jgi:hypothetical protein
MRRSLDKLLDLRISLSSQRVSGREDGGGGSGEFIGKSDLESDGRRQLEAAARAMKKKKGRADRADGGGNGDEGRRGEKT